MKKLLISIILFLCPILVKAETIYNSIIRDNELRDLPEDYNLFACISRDYLVPDQTGSCMLGYSVVEGFTNELEGLYPYEDDKGDIVFFRGDPANWVQLGTYNDDYYYFLTYVDDEDLNYKVGNVETCRTQSAAVHADYCTDTYKIGSKGDPIYWRIIRTNGDKSVRLVYSGVKINDYVDKMNIGACRYNQNPYGINMAGYTNKDEGVVYDSFIKQYIDNWYNLTKETYQKYVVKSTFVNDTKELYENCYNNIQSHLCFPRAKKLYYPTTADDIQPSLLKSNSTQDYGGDYNLEVGLFTVDELIMSGVSTWGYTPYTYLNPKMGYNSPNVDYIDNTIEAEAFWTMTPAETGFYHPQYATDLYGHSGDRYLRVYGTNSGVYPYDVGRNLFVRPVISIDGDTNVTGNGTSENPYRIENKLHIDLQTGSKSNNIFSYFENLDEDDSIEWTIDNPEILSIEENKIIPKKIGETKVHTTIQGVDYVLDIKITELINPSTRNNIITIFFILFLLSGFVFYMNKKELIK